MDIIPSRSFNLAYIIIDSLFLISFLVYLFLTKRKITFCWSLAGGVLYFLVDYGYFYLISKSRVITINGNVANDLDTALVLLWMSLSYGVSNFAFIWLCLDKKKGLMKDLMFIITWWLLTPPIAYMIPSTSITTSRTTNQYHLGMLIILLIAYTGLIIYDFYCLFKKRKGVNLLYLNLVGISVQFLWEGALLCSGIRPTNSSSFLTLLIDSLIETNLGMPYIYLIFILARRKYNEDLSKVKVKNG